MNSSSPQLLYMLDSYLLLLLIVRFHRDIVGQRSSSWANAHGLSHLLSTIGRKQRRTSNGDKIHPTGLHSSPIVSTPSMFPWLGTGFFEFPVSLRNRSARVFRSYRRPQTPLCQTGSRRYSLAAHAARPQYCSGIKTSLSIVPSTPTHSSIKPP